MDDSVVVQVEHLRKTYGTIVAVDDVSFRVRRGEIFGIVGPNGAGKTTTIGMLLLIVSGKAAYGLRFAGNSGA